MVVSKPKHLHSPCGCEQGSVGLLVGGLGYLLYLIFRSGGWGHPGWHGLWVGCAVVLITTSAGKFIGILMSRRKSLREVQKTQSETRPPRSPDYYFGPINRIDARPTSQCCGGK
jgi:hypothetical protein